MNLSKKKINDRNLDSIFRLMLLMYGKNMEIVSKFIRTIKEIP